MESNLYLSRETYLHLNYLASKLRSRYVADNCGDAEAVREELAELRRLCSRAVIAPQDADGLPCHHFPTQDGGAVFLDADSRYRFQLMPDALLTAETLQPALRFAGYLDGEVAFALIGHNVVVLLELEECGSCRADFEAAVHRAAAHALSEMPDFSTRTQTDGTGLVFRGPNVIALVPREEVDHRWDEVPLDAALEWRSAALEACDEDEILLLAVPAGQERLLAPASWEPTEEERSEAARAAAAEGYYGAQRADEPAGGVLPPDFAELFEPLPAREEEPGAEWEEELALLDELVLRDPAEGRAADCADEPAPAAHDDGKADGEPDCAPPCGLADSLEPLPHLRARERFAAPECPEGAE